MKIAGSPGGSAMAKVALLIGVSEYADGGLTSLPAAVKDIIAMQRVLQHPEIGGFAATDVSVLQNPHRLEMERSLYHLFAKRRKDDLVLLYFSGHSIKDETGKLYLATSETYKENNSTLVKPTAVSASYIHEVMSESRSQRQVIILDCCFSGAFPRGMTAKDDGTLAIEAQLGGEGRVILTSSTSMQYSFEQQGLDLSIYTHYLLEGIATGAADQDNDGWISIDELHSYVFAKVREAAPAMKPELYPMKEGHKILLAKSPKDDPKLKYRKQVELLLRENAGELSLINRSYLNELRHNLGLPENEAEAIEVQVLEPYHTYRKKVQRYQQVLTEALQYQYPLLPRDEKALLGFQQLLNLTDTDVAPIQAQIIAQHQIETQVIQIFTEEAGHKEENKGEENTKNSSPAFPLANSSHSNTQQENQDNEYTRLRDLLKSCQWREADEETAAVMQKIAGREKQAWVDKAIIKNFPCTDLNMINNLWLEYSNGRFGLSVQQQIFASVNHNWDEFGDRIGWCTKKGWFRRFRGSEIHWKTHAELTFNTTAPVGHLPILVVWEWRENLLFRVQACQQD